MNDRTRQIVQFGNLCPLSTCAEQLLGNTPQVIATLHDIQRVVRIGGGFRLGLGSGIDIQSRLRFLAELPVHLDTSRRLERFYAAFGVLPELTVYRAAIEAECVQTGLQFLHVITLHQRKGAFQRSITSLYTVVVEDCPVSGTMSSVTVALLNTVFRLLIVLMLLLMISPLEKALEKLFPDTKNQAALRMYEHCGFAPCSINMEWVG